MPRYVLVVPLKADIGVTLASDGVVARGRGGLFQKSANMQKDSGAGTSANTVVQSEPHDSSIHICVIYMTM